MDSKFIAPIIFLLLCGGIGFAFRDEIRMIIAHEARPPANKDAAPRQKIELDAAKLSAVYDRLKIKPITDELATTPEIGRALKDLTESVCDKTAIFRLSNALFESGEKRTAADALLGFAGACPNSEGELNGAANVLFGIGDYAAVLPLADKLVAQRPEVGQYYYTRAQALESLGRHEEAIQDYVSTIGLFDDIKQVSSQAFTQLAQSYAATSKFCQAMTAIQTYVSADAATRDTAPARKLIAEYAGKGNCETGYAEGSETIPRSQKGVILAKVAVNGVKGNFVIDTGASMVALDPAFAQKAKIGTENARTVMMHTANGISKAMLTSASRVELGKVAAQNVSTVVVEKPFGGGIDGLLGMSFLARFDITLGEKDIRVQSRKMTPP